MKFLLILTFLFLTISCKNETASVVASENNPLRKPTSDSMTTEIIEGVLVIDSSGNPEQLRPRIVEVFCTDERLLNFIEKSIDTYNSDTNAFIESVESSESNFVIKLSDKKNKTTQDINIPQQSLCITTVMKIKKR